MQVTGTMKKALEDDGRKGKKRQEKSKRVL